MALRALASRWPKAATVAAASFAAGGVALCDPDIRGQMFDPEALERGAKALREINQSPHAKRVWPEKVQYKRRYPPGWIRTHGSLSLLVFGSLRQSFR